MSKIFNPSDIQKQSVKSMTITIDGEEGVVYYKPITSRMLHSLAEGDLSDKDAITKISTRLAETLVNQDGTPLMTVDQLFDTPWETQKYIMERIAEETNKGRDTKSGEGSSGVQSSGQSTN